MAHYVLVSKFIFSYKKNPHVRVPVGLPGFLHHLPAPGPLLLRSPDHRVLDADLPPVPRPLCPVQRSEAWREKQKLYEQDKVF